MLNALEKSSPSFIANDADAQTIAQFFRQLPQAESYRCHIPPYGFKFHLCDGTTNYVSLCWECNNAYVWMPDAVIRRTGFAFDGKSESAQELFKLCYKFLPIEIY